MDPYPQRQNIRSSGQHGTPEHDACVLLHRPS